MAGLYCLQKVNFEQVTPCSLHILTAGGALLCAFSSNDRNHVGEHQTKSLKPGWNAQCTRKTVSQGNLKLSFFLILALGIHLSLHFSKQAMLFCASISYSLYMPFAGNTCSRGLCLTNSFSSSKTQLRCHLLSEAFPDWPFSWAGAPLLCVSTTP